MSILDGFTTGAAAFLTSNAVQAGAFGAAGLTWLASKLKTDAVKRKQSHLAQIEGTVVRLSGGIAATLLAHPQGTPQDVLAVVRNAGVAEATTYIQTQMPGVVAAAGADATGLQTMLRGEVGRQIVAAGLGGSIAAAPLLQTAAAGLLAAADPVQPADPTPAAP